MFEDERAAAAAATYLLETAPVLALQLDESHRVVHANVLARSLLGDKSLGVPVEESLLNSPGSPDLAFLLERGDQVHRLTIGTSSGMPETFSFRFFTLPVGTLALGSIDLDEQRRLVGKLASLNRELNVLTRQLYQANAELQDLNEFRNRHAREASERNEALRQQSLASLNLMEDAVAARVRTEQVNRALEESEAQFRSLIEWAPDAVFVVTDLRFSYLNPASCRMFGADSPEQLLGQPLLNSIAPSSHQLVHARIHRVFDEEVPAPTVEEIWLRLDGRTFPVDVSSVPFTYRGRKSALTFARDVTERKAAEEARRRSESNYRSILEATPDALGMVGSDGRIAYVNTQAERMFGRSRDELLGCDSTVLFPERLMERHLRQRAVYFRDFHLQTAGAVIDPIELAGLRADGTEFPIEIRTSPFEIDGDRRILAQIRDVTERNAAEQKRLELERTLAVTKEATKAKSSFLSTISHEIRTPLNAILGYSQLMMRDPGLGKDSIASLKVINRSGEHLLSIINDVLDMARIESGHVQLTPRTFNVRSLLRDLEAMFRLPAQAKQVEFEVVLDGDLVEFIVADEGKVRQVLINLVSNAIKFTERGRIHVRVSLSRRVDDRLWLSARVMDSGIGMTTEEQKRLFQPFIQGKRGQNINQGGTGLGLAISRGVAREMGGEIGVTSRPGVGSTFLFEVPVEPGAARDFFGRPGRRGRVLGIRADQEAPRILIADDLPDNREWLDRLLTGLGFCVRSVEDGKAAVLAWTSWNPKLILMDVHMPVLDGLEATRRIRSSQAGDRTVIIALTADAMEEQHAAAFASGVNAFISKPCSESELLEKIQIHLGVVYVYEEENQCADTLLPAVLPPGHLSPDLIGEMRGAILNGDKALLDALILSVEQRGDASLARTLRKLADLYEYDMLLELFAHVS